MNTQAPEGERFLPGEHAAAQALPIALQRELSQLSMFSGGVGVLRNVATVALLVALALIFWNPLVIFLVIVAMAGPQHGFVVLAHDAVHYRLFPSRRLNEVVGTLCAAVVGVNLAAYRVVHRLHHNNLYQSNDPDLPLMAGYPRGKRYLVRKLLRDLSGLTAYKTYSYFFGNPNAKGEEHTVAPANLVDDTSARLKAAVKRDRRVVLGVQLAMLLTSVVTGYLWVYLLLWVCPLLTVLQALLRIRAILEHGAVPQTSNPLEAARSNHAPWWVRWWLFPHQVNYHIEHHLYPSVPFYNLARTHRELTQRGALAGAEVISVWRTFPKIFAARAQS